jgi:hypothetical protein
MDRPVPDGHILLTFNHPVRSKVGNLVSSSAEDYELYIEFAEVMIVKPDEMGLRIRLRSNRWVTYPWSALQCWEHVGNSDEYMKAFRAYQLQHNHTWVFGDTYVDTPPNVGFYWYCGPSMEGDDEGCGHYEYRSRDDQGRTIEEIQEAFMQGGPFDA